MATDEFLRTDEPGGTDGSGTAASSRDGHGGSGGDGADVQLATAEPHPDVQAVLRDRERFQFLPLPTLGARGTRLLTKFALWLQDQDSPAVGDVTDLTIPGPEGDIPVRRYRPQSEGPYPTVVFYHGGGFVLGNLETHDLFCRHLTNESDCEVVSVDYRLAPEHPFPAAVEDAYAAIEWADSGPAVLDDDGHLAVAGDSAGGTLSAVVSLMAAEQDGPALDYQTLIYPAVGSQSGQGSMQDHSEYVLTDEVMEWFGDCYYGSDVHRRNPYADPTRACDVSGVAPATVVTAGFDPLRDGGIEYARKLVADGVSVRFRNYPSMVHGFATMLSDDEDVDRAHEAVGAIGEDLRDALAGA